jgi:hypothetical protein
MEDGTTGHNLMRIIWSKDAEKIGRKISTHHFCQSTKEETLCHTRPLAGMIAGVRQDRLPEIRNKEREAQGER